MDFSPADHEFMARALRLAERGRYTTRPNPNVGCVVVRDGVVVGEGYHVRAGEPHAEVFALRAAGEAARGATAYVTLEPCSHHGRTPPCADALVAAGVRRVVTAMQDPNPRVAGAGLKRLRDAGVEVQSGLLEAESAGLNPGFVKRMRTGLPWVRVKLAMSLDGRTAMASGESQWITSTAARIDVQRWRARAGAILTGAGTVRVDDPGLNLRIDAATLGCAEVPGQPLRVVLDPRLSTSRSSKIYNLTGNSLIFISNKLSVTSSPMFPAGVEHVAVSGSSGALDLPAVLRELGRREINECHVEAGATLSGALLAAGLVDELVLYVAPHLMGDGARPLLNLPGIERMAQRLPLRIADIRSVGPDWRIIAHPQKPRDPS